MKTCFKCKIKKPLSEFYRHSQMADGYLNKCKECAKLDVRTHRRQNEHVRQADRERHAQKSTDPVYLQKRRDYQLEYMNDHPEAKAAHRALNIAVRWGRIKKQPCSNCGSTENLHAHHEDYSKPLDVIWLCCLCHRREHGGAVKQE